MIGYRARFYQPSRSDQVIAKIAGEWHLGKVLYVYDSDFAAVIFERRYFLTLPTSELINAQDVIC